MWENVDYISLYRIMFTYVSQHSVEQFTRRQLPYLHSRHVHCCANCAHEGANVTYSELYSDILLEYLPSGIYSPSAICLTRAWQCFIWKVFNISSLPFCLLCLFTLFLLNVFREFILLPINNFRILNIYSYPLLRCRIPNPNVVL